MTIRPSVTGSGSGSGAGSGSGSGVGANDNSPIPDGECDSPLHGQGKRMGVRPVGPAAVWVWCVDPTAKAVGFGYAARHAAGLETGTGTGSGTVSGVGANDNSPFLPPQTRSVIPQRRRGYPSTGELSEARDTLRGIGIPSRAESVAARMGPGPVRDRVPRGRVPRAAGERSEPHCVRQRAGDPQPFRGRIPA